MKTKQPIPAVPDYIRAAVEAVLAADVNQGVVHVVAEHDADCPMASGGHRCTCTPTLTVCKGSA